MAPYLPINMELGVNIQLDFVVKLSGEKKVGKVQVIPNVAAKMKQ